MSFSTPVLLLVWRRPNSTKQVIDAIREVTPTQIFVACDGPRSDKLDDNEKVMATRQIIDKEIDWPCKIEHLYRDTNLGCCNAVSSALDWFFDQVEEGIVLEDDCIPHPSFFSYSAELLERYRNNPRIYAISGNNFQDGFNRGEGSYYFSRYPHCWGWATWSSAWKNYDGDMKDWPIMKDSGDFYNMFESPLESKYWADIFDRLYYENSPDSWAYRWYLSCLKKDGLIALPNFNLVTNIGFGEDATHTIGKDVWMDKPRKSIDNINHPASISRDSEADSYTFNNIYYKSHAGGKTSLKKRIYKKFRNFIYRFF